MNKLQEDFIKGRKESKEYFKDMDKRVAGRLEKWEVYSLYDRKEDRTIGSLVYGYVYGDERWKDGSYIHTSQVVKISEDKKNLETENSFYTLGERKDETEGRSKSKRATSGDAGDSTGT